MTIQVATRPRRQRATLRVRQSITEMSTAEVNRFRKAIEKMLDVPDNRGYHFFAGWHGVPLAICEHHNVLFLPWHRGYLYHFELALQDIDPAVTLPWWNWEDEPGIPAAFEAVKVGGRKNVLASAPIKPFGVQPRPGWPKKTHRDPGGHAPGEPAAPAPPYAGATPWLKQAKSYESFRNRVEELHDSIHVWAGGDGGEIGDPNWAAYDPLFWAHHTMVDRLWRIWQHQNKGANPSAATMERSMTFAKSPSLRVREVLDVKELGYEYAGQTDTVEGPG